MKLVKSKFEILEQKPRAIAIPDDMEIGPAKVKQELIGTAYRQIELAGRTCYKSEDKITEDSAEGFVERMINSGHGAMLEHGTIYLTFFVGSPFSQGYFKKMMMGRFYQQNKYSKVVSIPNADYTGNTYYVTTNLRVLVENNRMDDLEYISECLKEHERRITVRFTCDRGVSHEFVRHRVFSFAQESTRYCNYSKNKFGNELTYIIPSWMDMEECDIPTSENGWSLDHDFEFLTPLGKMERYYFSLLDLGWKPQQARQVLPNALKTELIMTGLVSDWKHFFELRDAPTAHPDAQALAEPLHEEFIKRNYITNE